MTEDGWLITPAFTAGDDTWLSFWEKTLWPGDYAGHYLYVCDTTNDCSAPPTNWVQLAETGALPNTSWRFKTYDLSAYSGASVKVAFVYTGNYADGWYIDNVKVQDFLDGLPISNVHIPVAVLPSTGNLPALMQFDTYRNAGAATIPDLVAVEITDLTIDTYGFVKGEQTVINLAEDPTNDSPFDDLSQVYYQMIPLPDGAARFVAETIASTAPDVDLFWGYDFNGNGLPDEDEQLGSSATSSAIEYVSDVWFPPLPNDLWVVVQNWSGSGAPTDAITLSVGVVPYAPPVPSTMTVTGPASNPAGNPFSLDVYWHDIESQEGDRLYGLFDVYTDSAYTTEIGYTQVDVIRKADDVTKTADMASAYKGDTVTYTITIAPNVFPNDLTYTIEDVIPANMTYVPGSVTGGATYNAADNSIEWSGVMTGVSAMKYYVSTNETDPNCYNLFTGGYEYFDMQTGLGWNTNAGLAGNNIAWSYSSGAVGGNMEFFGAPISINPIFTDDGYAILYTPNTRSTTNQDIPDPTLPNGIISALWNDMVIVYDAATNKGVTAGGAAGPTGFFMIEFDDIQPASDATSSIDFEIMALHTADPGRNGPDIMVAYDNVTGTYDWSQNTIGLENYAGTEAAKFNYNSIAPTNDLIVCFDWAPILGEAKVITFQATVDTDLYGDIVNEAGHTNDGLGSLPEVAKAVVNINYNTPTAVDDNYSMQENTILSVAAPGVFGNDSGVGPNNFVAVLETPAAHGTVSLLADGSFTYTPDADFTGTDTFTYMMVTYPAKAWVDSAQVTITVNPWKYHFPVIFTP
jgi:uncharacterized repeat protein (TIGR01451 family)